MYLNLNVSVYISVSIYILKDHQRKSTLVKYTRDPLLLLQGVGVNRSAIPNHAHFKEELKCMCLSDLCTLDQLLL